MEKQGVIDEHTPPEHDAQKTAAVAQSPQAVATERENHLTTRARQQAVEKLQDHQPHA